MPELKPIPCTNCGKTLCKGTVESGVIEIKCTKCGSINILSTGLIPPVKFMDERKWY